MHCLCAPALVDQHACTACVHLMCMRCCLMAVSALSAASGSPSARGLLLTRPPALPAARPLQVAVKVLEHVEQAEAEAQAQDPIFEALLCTQLSHPNVVQTFKYITREAVIEFEDGDESMLETWLVGAGRGQRHRGCAVAVLQAAAGSGACAAAVCCWSLWACLCCLVLRGVWLGDVQVRCCCAPGLTGQGAICCQHG